MAADISSVPVTGTWHRHVPPGADPLAIRQPAPDGRWQRGSEIAGLYLAQDEPTAWAEWYRALAEIGEPPDSRLPRDLWRLTVDATPVADMTAPAALRALGLPDPVPERAQWPAFQAAGAHLATGGYAAVLFRSTARPTGLCLSSVRPRQSVRRRQRARTARADHGGAHAATRHAHLSAARSRRS